MLNYQTDDRDNRYFKSYFQKQKVNYLKNINHHIVLNSKNPILHLAKFNLFYY